ncbi:hypothetical protein LIER_29554 [Lithospermum erythrorhizon]|uniref:Uncharacterized protein n=1 Tax=Lithospermum erythrorhizon TaxID=34254 RepID=A0AAV3RMW7_LITER
MSLDEKETIPKDVGADEVLRVLLLCMLRSGTGLICIKEQHATEREHILPFVSPTKNPPTERELLGFTSSIITGSSCVKS